MSVELLQRTRAGDRDAFRERDGFGPFVACLRAERHVDRAVEHGVGEWLEPHDFTSSTVTPPSSVVVSCFVLA
jgi:hypothetical protein